MRQHGELTRVKFRDLTPADMQALLSEIMSPAQKAEFEQASDIDFAYEVADVARFRVNVFRQRKGMGCVMRTIPSTLLSADELNLPEGVRRFCKLTKGLVLVTGPTGSGKSTTLAAMLDKINSERHEHMITIEDPIEYLHSHKKCVVNQREVHADTHSFTNALRSALREDPDVVLIGEMRDLETIEAALRIAETGHLTFATLHTNSAAQTINRIVDVFPAHQQSQIRAQLSLVLEGIMCQSLLPKASGTGRCLALEIMVPNAAIRNLIREDKIHQIYSAMQTGQEKFGMQTFNQSLASLYFAKQLNLQTALGISSNPDELQDMINRGAGLATPQSGGRPPMRPAGR
jgi:twitching motility protein PilT